MGDIQETLFLYDNILHLQGLLFFADASTQISEVSSTFSATDHKHVLLVCFDMFSSMFLILNHI